MPDPMHSEATESESNTVWIVWDNTTNNQLGEFATREKAQAWLEEIRPLGRFGPDGHDLQVYAEPIQ